MFKIIVIERLFFAWITSTNNVVLSGDFRSNLSTSTKILARVTAETSGINETTFWQQTSGCRGDVQKQNRCLSVSGFVPSDFDFTTRNQILFGWQWGFFYPLFLQITHKPATKTERTQPQCTPPPPPYCFPLTFCTIDILTEILFL